MSRVDNFNIAPEDEEGFFKYLRWGNRFVNERIIAKRRPLSRGEKKALGQITTLGDIGFLWQSLTDQERTDWADAGYWSAQTGYALFVQDTSYRISNGIGGLAIPSVFHQYKVGKIHVAGVVQYSGFFQNHYNPYTIARKITGTQNSYEPVEIAETYEMPFNLGLNFKSNLSMIGSTPYASFFLELQWEDEFDNYDDYYEISIPLNSDWDYSTLEIPSVPGTVFAYTPYFEFHNVVGELYFDVPELLYNDQNWTRDANCDLIGVTLPDLGVPIDPLWEKLYLSQNASIQSIYPPD